MKKVKKKKAPIRTNKDSRFRGFIMSTLRRSSRYWAPATECKADARMERGVYLCAICKKATRAKDIKIDHIEPVVPLEGFTNWGDIIERMFCEKDGFQTVCESCHDIKTLEEREIRKINKKLVDALDKDVLD